MPSGTGIAQFYFTPPLPGEYKIEAALVGEDGKETDKKSGTITAKVAAAAPAENKAADVEDN